jgi:nicotinate phosphoribosyltransferase
MRWPDEGDLALFTDLYELTMAASFHAHGIDHVATFDLFVRSLPPSRNFLVACGIDDALTYLDGLSMSDAAAAYLRSLPEISGGLVDRLCALDFTGDVWGIPEGEVVFPNEPILRVTAPLIEAQVVETFLINCVASQTMVASKAARVAIACKDREFADFSARRDHGLDAALKGARAAYIGGASSTSLVVAGQRYGIPLSGTMAHSYVMSFDDELEAFRSFARDFPEGSTLLIDTYDTEEGARRAVQVAEELAPEGVRLRGVRLDSGDLGRLARCVRTILDDAGLHDVAIVASGDLDEYRITELVASGAPVDVFGVGTQLGTSADAPYLSGVYKLVEDVHGPRIKLAEGKVTVPGRKQVWRVGEGTESAYDVLALEDEEVAGGRPLLEPMITGGRRLAASPPLDEIRCRRQAAVGALPSRLRTITAQEVPYEVRPSDGLAELVARLRAQHAIPREGR